jgi:hypothetical protein
MSVANTANVGRDLLGGRDDLGIDAVDEAVHDVGADFVGDQRRGVDPSPIRDLIRATTWLPTIPRRSARHRRRARSLRTRCGRRRTRRGA